MSGPYPTLLPSWIFAGIGKRIIPSSTICAGLGFPVLALLPASRTF